VLSEASKDFSLPEAMLTSGAMWSNAPQ